MTYVNAVPAVCVTSNTTGDCELELNITAGANSEDRPVPAKEYERKDPEMVS